MFALREKMIENAEAEWGVRSIFISPWQTVFISCDKMKNILPFEGQ